jgi:hypothetical protein
MHLNFIRPDWVASPQLRAAFTLRSGGASGVPWQSLNVGAHVGDDPLAVRQNRARVRDALELPAEPLWLEQVHGNAVHLAQSGTAPVTPPRVDAIVTRDADVVLAIMVADCLPVLFATDDGAVLGAAHAGWRGLVAGVLENTVAAMQAQPARIRAWLGPCIGRAHFEVGAEVREAFLSAGDEARHFEPNPLGRYQCDLVGLARARLARAGVVEVSGGSWCTAADPIRFYSHRRDQRTGRMAALLWRAASHRVL